MLSPGLVKGRGGLLEGCRSTCMADTHYVAVAPHCVANPVGTIASAHFAVSVPNPDLGGLPKRVT